MGIARRDISRLEHHVVDAAADGLNDLGIVRSGAYDGDSRGSLILATFKSSDPHFLANVDINSVAYNEHCFVVISCYCQDTYGCAGHSQVHPI